MRKESSMPNLKYRSDFLMSWNELKTQKPLYAVNIPCESYIKTKTYTWNLPQFWTPKVTNKKIRKKKCYARMKENDIRI